MLKYRTDIDSLRAISVIAVITFHFSFNIYGYLGVDIFYVISGYLICQGILSKYENLSFDIFDFYIRRLRRIFPLLLFVILISFVWGIIVMLPDDLENLSNSIIATLLFSNNVLQYITTGNYWDVANEIKPFAHTWSLGVEEQFYLLFPFLFLFKLSINRIHIILFFLTLISFLLFLNSTNNFEKFYLLQYRFFEISLGCLLAFSKFKISSYFKFVFFVILLILIFSSWPLYFNDSFRLLTVIIFTALFLVSDNTKSICLIENNLLIHIGKISFSLYLWHQIYLAFFKYYIIEEFSILTYVLISFLILFSSEISYKYIELKFRSTRFISNKFFLIFTCLITLFLLSSASYISYKKGILKDYPELNIYYNNAQLKKHGEYNDRIYSYNKNFDNNSKIKVLIVGNSFARDFGNILLESNIYKISSFQLKYIQSNINKIDLIDNVNKADIVFFAMDKISNLEPVLLPFNKVFFVGPKNFGVSNGYFYNNNDINLYCLQRTKIRPDILKDHFIQKSKYGKRYIDLISPLIDDHKKVPVFTSNCKFISPDCTHLTIDGAKFYSLLLENHLVKIFDNLNVKL